MEIPMNPQLPEVQYKDYTSTRRPCEAGRNPFDGLRPWSAITHAAGIVFGIVGTIFLLIHAIPTHDLTGIISFAIFGATMVLLYTASTLYHSVHCSAEGRIALRKFDHISVNMLIAGTYTPVCLTILNGAVGYTILAIIWALAIAGAFVSFFWVNSPRKVTAGIYIGLGWFSIVALPFIWSNAGPAPVLGLFGGGLFYTIGAILYAIKWPGRNNPRFGCHEIFHVFIVLGTIAQYLTIYNFM